MGRKIKCRTEFDENYNANDYAISEFSPSMAIQSARDECDINNIIRKHAVGIPVTHVVDGHQVFGDFSDVEDFQTAQQRVIEAHEAFASLPAHIRRRFDDDPTNLIAFVSDENNLDEAIKLGLCEAKKVAEDNNVPQKATETKST